MGDGQRIFSCSLESEKQLVLRHVYLNERSVLRTFWLEACASNRSEIAVTLRSVGFNEAHTDDLDAGHSATIAFQLENENLLRRGTTTSDGSPPESRHTSAAATAAVVDDDDVELYNNVGHVDRVVLSPGERREVVLVFRPTNNDDESDEDADIPESQAHRGASAAQDSFFDVKGSLLFESSLWGAGLSDESGDSAT